MNKTMLFTDGSVNNQSKIGYGAYLAISEQGVPLYSLKNNVKVKKFEHTSSTKLELQTLLWALTDIQLSSNKLIIYTDSQNIISLPRRRSRFEKNNYYSKNNKRLNNYELYQEFYRVTDKLNYELIKVKGHQAADKKDDIDKLFSLVDKASRNARLTPSN
jgi:ribonuclease HI